MVNGSIEAGAVTPAMLLHDQQSNGTAMRLDAQCLEQVLLQGDLAKLTADQRLSYYQILCQSVGLNPLTKPFEYIRMNGRLTLYALKSCTEQLRKMYDISVVIQNRESFDGVYVVTARATMPNGRTDESIGAVPIDNIKGEDRSNSMMRAETKAKRRVTLSICGLAFLDENEVPTVPGSTRVPVDTNTGEILSPDPDPQGLTIDIGKEKYGTQEAATHVAERKIAELQAITEFSWRSSGEMRRAFLAIREIVSETPFLTELERYGYHNLEELITAAIRKAPNSRDHAVAIYRYLSLLAQPSQSEVA